MQITQHTDYAFRVLLYAASNPDRLVNISKIAEDYDISKTHLMKVVPALVKAGCVDSVRGASGGLKLAKPPEKIKIGDVFRQLESMQLVECFRENNRCYITPACRLYSVFDGAQKAFLHYLDSYTLADMLNQRLIDMLKVEDKAEGSIAKPLKFNNGLAKSKN